MSLERGASDPKPPLRAGRGRPGLGVGTGWLSDLGRWAEGAGPGSHAHSTRSGGGLAPTAVPLQLEALCPSCHPPPLLHVLPSWACATCLLGTSFPPLPTWPLLQQHCPRS